jgi:hypothetical protein
MLHIGAFMGPFSPHVPITSFNSSSEFYVGDQLVLASSSTHVVLRGKPFAPDLAVKVTGVFDASGALIASEMHAKPHP